MISHIDIHGLLSGRQYCCICNQLCVYPKKEHQVDCCSGCYYDVWKNGTEKHRSETAYCCTFCGVSIPKESIKRSLALGRRPSCCKDCANGNEQKTREQLIDALAASISS